jgi:hypothetical protein
MLPILAPVMVDVDKGPAAFIVYGCCVEAQEVALIRALKMPDKLLDRQRA